MRTFRVYRRAIPDGHYPGEPPDQPQTEGVVFRDGTCVTRWIGEHAGTEVWRSFADFDRVHGHPEYDSQYVWFDGLESTDQTPQPGRALPPTARPVRRRRSGGSSHAAPS